MAHEYYGDGRTRRLEWSGGFFQKVVNEKIWRVYGKLVTSHIIIF